MHRMVRSLFLLMFCFDITDYCEVDMDEDDAARLMQGHYRECPYYQLDDEYAVVRHQM